MLNQLKILRVLQLIALLKKQPPKSIQSLADFLNNTERTVYRYLDLLRELGFDLKKDEKNRFLIVGENPTDEKGFSIEETTFLNKLLENSNDNPQLRESLLKKIHLQSEAQFHGKNLLNAQMMRQVEKLSTAIENNLQVILKDYHSVSSQKIEDRLIEPIKFNENFDSICAFEVKTKENKIYKMERFNDLEILDTPICYKSLHRFIKLDPFGFAPTGNPPVRIDLTLNLRSYILLKEQFPAVTSFVVHDEKNNKYTLNIDVNDPRPVLRFLMGLLDDIIVHGSLEFEEYILEYVNRLFLERPED